MGTLPAMHRMYHASILGTFSAVIEPPTEFEMVTAPQRPLTHSYDPAKNPMDLVDTASGPMERWRADALLVGETSALTEIIKQIQNEFCECPRTARCARA